MKILLTNDDGIYAEGIRTLARILSKNNHEICVVAPDRERSAAGHSITINEPLRVNNICLENIRNIKCYKINGTPADCVKLGIEKLFEPDLILSGINDGGNLGYDVLYSGTVSAAIEGWMIGYNSIAVSLKTENNRNFIGSANFIKNLLTKLNLKQINDKLLLNINIPDKKYKNLTQSTITTLGKNIYEDHFEKRLDPMGNKYYWITGKINNDASQNTDIATLNRGEISITPLKLELTNEEQVKQLKKIF